MLTKFHSEESADFVMLASAAEQLLTMMGHGGSAEGSVSGDTLSRALERLDSAVANAGEPQQVSDIDDDENSEEPEEVSLSARAEPLIAMLRKARKAEGYVMWRKD